VIAAHAQGLTIVQLHVRHMKRIFRIRPKHHDVLRVDVNRRAGTLSTNSTIIWTPPFLRASFHNR
jgi:hypothetical protein